MDTETGKIYMSESLSPEEIKRHKLVMVDEEKMTRKQKKNLQVSKFDNRSELGKIFTEERRKRKTKKEKANDRKEFWAKCKENEV